MGDEAKTQSWWQTLPGILTSATATITAVAGLLAVLHQLSSNSKPPVAEPAAVVSPQAVSASSPVTPAANSTAAEANAASEHQVLTGRFANRCGCWGVIKYGTTHPDLRCESGLAVARKCVETCPNGDHAWHYECE